MLIACIGVYVVAPDILREARVFSLAQARQELPGRCRKALCDVVDKTGSVAGDRALPGVQPYFLNAPWSL